MFVIEKFIKSFVKRYRKYILYFDEGTWYPEAYNVLRVKHYLHSPFEKNLMERGNQ